MKNLVAKAGVAAVTSVLLSSVISVPEAQAFQLAPSALDTLSFGSDGSDDGIALRNYPIELYENYQPGIVEVGEIAQNEIRGYVEFDISRYKYLLDLPDYETRTFDIGFNIIEENGTNFGSLGPGSNSETYYDGILSAYWYLGSNFPYPDESVFNVDEFPLFNPLGQFDLSQYGAGDRLTFDTANVTAIVKGLLDPANNLPSYFGIMFVAEDFRIYNEEGQFVGSSGGQCGPNDEGDRALYREQCSGVLLGNFDIVPTPAAILPTLFGMAAAAFRKKNGAEEA